MAVYDTPLKAPADNRLVYWTDWDGYLKFLDAAGDGSLRLTYDQGTLELMTPSIEHEQNKSVLARLLEILFLERDIDYRLGGATTLKRKDLDRGLEPDECYWLHHWQTAKAGYDVSRDPPPDLVLEVEVSRTAVSRLGIYRALGVPEIWRYRSTDVLEIWCLREGDYQQVERSPHLPDIDPQLLARFVVRARDVSVTQTLREFRAQL